MIPPWCPRFNMISLWLMNNPHTMHAHWIRNNQLFLWENALLMRLWLPHKKQGKELLQELQRIMLHDASKFGYLMTSCIVRWVPFCRVCVSPVCATYSCIIVVFCVPKLNHCQSESNIDMEGKAWSSKITFSCASRGWRKMVHRTRYGVPGEVLETFMKCSILEDPNFIICRPSLKICLAERAIELCEHATW